VFTQVCEVVTSSVSCKKILHSKCLFQCAGNFTTMWTRGLKHTAGGPHVGPEGILCGAGADTASNARGGDFSNIWKSSLITTLLL